MKQNNFFRTLLPKKFKQMYVPVGFILIREP